MSGRKAQVARRHERERNRRRARRQAELEQARRRTTRWKTLTTGGLLLVIIGVVAVIELTDTHGGAGEPPEGTRSFRIASRSHVEGAVSYAHVPPPGGDHSPTWQDCGFYSQPVASEQAVHSMEHGAVWIAFRPDLPSDQVEHLREVTSSEPLVLSSPFPGLRAPVVVSAWGRQLSLDHAADPSLEQFVRAFVAGPQAPEPGAPCTGGAGT